MKRFFCALFLIFFTTSCEDDINSPDADSINLPGCNDFTACNYDVLANINNGSCIYAEDECDQFDSCDEGYWQHHTCFEVVGNEEVPNWNGSIVNCTLIYTEATSSCQDGEGTDYVDWDNTELGCDSGYQYTSVAATCVDTDGVNYLNWDQEVNSRTGGYQYTSGICETDDGADDGGTDDGGTDGE